VDISGLYWRVSALSARNCPPGLLALTDDRLSFTTADARVFDAPLADVSGRLTGWGSLVLEAGSARVVLVANVGQLSPPFTSTQQTVIAAAKRAGTLRSIDDWPALLTGVAAPRLAYRRWVLGGIFIVLAAAAVVAIGLNGGL